MYFPKSSYIKQGFHFLFLEIFQFSQKIWSFSPQRILYLLQNLFLDFTLLLLFIESFTVYYYSFFLNDYSSILPGKFHRWGSLVGYGPWGRKELDTIEQLHFLSFCSSFCRRKWQPTSVFLPGESHGQRGLVGCGLWGCKESDTTKQLTHTAVIQKNTINCCHRSMLSDYIDYFIFVFSPPTTVLNVPSSSFFPLILYASLQAKLLQPCLTFCSPMGHSLSGSSVHGSFPARILEWVAMPSSRGSS